MPTPPHAAMYNQCQIKKAHMYVYFTYAHKASWQSEDDSPYLCHTAQLHVLKEEWKEDEATTMYR